MPKVLLIINKRERDIKQPILSNQCERRMQEYAKVRHT